MSAAAPGSSKAAHGDASAKKKKGPGALATAYLVIYNVVMTAGWAACFPSANAAMVCVRACVCQQSGKIWLNTDGKIFIFYSFLFQL